MLFFSKVKQCKFLLEDQKSIDLPTCFRVDGNDADTPAPDGADTPDKFPVIWSTLRDKLSGSNRSAMRRVISGFNSIFSS
ncbi:MAG: hypothetical protein WC620_09535 [Methanoregula sp.]